MTRVGVFDYRQPDGTVRRELRPSNEVFKQESLDSLIDAPVLAGHPAMVTPENYSQYTKGNVSGTPKQDGKFVSSKLAVQDGTTLDGIDSGEIVEVSCGYTCDVVQQSGVFDGQPYDAVQTNIKYNHVGLGPRNWGRQGNDVALRLDGGAYIDSATEGSRKMVIKFDGKDYEKGSDEHLTALTNKLDSYEVQRKETQTKLDKAEAQNAIDAKTIEEHSKKLATFDAEVSARADLLAQAKIALGETTVLDGKTNAEIKTEVVKLNFPNVKLDGRSDDYITALYERAIETGVRADSIQRLPEAVRKAQGASEREDKKDEKPAELKHVWAATKENC